MAVSDCATGLLGAQAKDLSMEGALVSQPRGVGAPREDESSALQGLARFGGSCRERDRERQRYARPARSLPNKRERVAARKKRRAAPLTGEVEASRSR